MTTLTKQTATIAATMTWIEARRCLVILWWWKMVHRLYLLDNNSSNNPKRKEMKNRYEGRGRGRYHIAPSSLRAQIWHLLRFQTEKLKTVLCYINRNLWTKIIANRGQPKIKRNSDVDRSHDRNGLKVHINTLLLLLKFGNEPKFFGNIEPRIMCRKCQLFVKNSIFRQKGVVRID